MELGRKIAEGNTAEVFEYGKDRICKLFHKGYPRAAVEREYRNASVFYEKTLLSPKCHETVTFGGRDGIIYDRLTGHDLTSELLETADSTLRQILADTEGLCERLSSCVFGEERMAFADGLLSPESAQYAALRGAVDRFYGIIGEMAGLHKKLLSGTSDEALSYKEFLGNFAAKSGAADEIDRLADGNTLCHGDFHPGNVWRNEDGSLCAIDFMNVCRAPRGYDIARTWVLFTEDLDPDSPEYMRALKKWLGGLYLYKMGVGMDDIAGFIRVINLCRSAELGRL